MAGKNSRSKTKANQLLRADFGSLGPSSLNRDDGTIWAVAVPADAIAERYGYDPEENFGAWLLQLDMDGLDASRFVGANFLTDHEARVATTIGVIVEYEIADGALQAKVKFSTRDDVQPIIGDIEAGILRGVSIGFTVQQYERSGDIDGVPLFIARKWQPYELSLTPTPALAGATVLARKDDAMPEHYEPDSPAEDQKIELTLITKDEPKPASPRDVRTIFYAAGLKPEDADDAIDQRLTIDAVNARATAHLVKVRASQPATTARPASDHQDPSAVRLAMVDALAARMQPGTKIDGLAAKYRGYRLADLAVELAAMDGITFDNPRSAESVFAQLFSGPGAHSSSDFPKLLEAAANKTLMARYQAAAPTYRAWCAQRSFADFKAHKFLRLGDFPAFTASPEPATVTFGTASENRESVTAAAYTSGISFTREALINDDLGALSDFAGMVGVRATADENRLAYAALAANGTLADGVAIFSTASTRLNLASSGGAIDVTTVAAGRKAMRNMTSLDGLKLNIMPRYLVVGPAYELIAEQLLTAIQAAVITNVNPFSGKLELVVDANITGNAWYLFADPAAVPCFVYGYVAGAQGPEVWVTRNDNTRALDIRAGLDFAVGAIDFRGAYKNPGA